MKTKLLILILVILAVLALGIIAVQAQGSGPLHTSAALEAALQDPNLDAQLRKSLEEKLEMAQRMESDRTTGEKNAAPKQPGVPPDFGEEAAKAIPTPPTGIFEGGEAIIHGYEASILNHWQGTPEGRLTQVYAGSLANDPDQGVLFVVRWSDSSAPQITRFLTPSRDGAARILSEQDGLLQGETAGGSAWAFDWRSEEFK